MRRWVIVSKPSQTAWQPFTALAWKMGQHFGHFGTHNPRHTRSHLGEFLIRYPSTRITACVRRF